MKYMLDTNIVIYVIKHKPEFVIKKFLSLEPDDLCISAITFAEMEYGVSKSSRPEQNQAALTLFLEKITILPFDDKAGQEYGDIRADLERHGTQIEPNDMLIAAHARSQGLTLVTNHTREFERVKGLNLENWV